MLQPSRLLFLAGLLSLACLSGCGGKDPMSRCGDGKLQAAEVCDDGNTTDGDGCESNCSLTPAPDTCGNGSVDTGEQCDDGNRTSGDGCEANCFPTANPDDGGTGGGSGGGSGGGAGGGTGGGTGICGNGARESTEWCDDGNATAGDGCESNCRFSPATAYCGDGLKNGAEACDDGNLVSGDGCEVDCTASVSAGGNCGDGVRQGEELCDDGNSTSADGCESDCTLTTTAVVQCPAASQPTSSEDRCDVVPGTGATLVVGTVLLPGRVLEGGQVLWGADGNITCVGCDCSASAGAATATVLLCGQNVVSPGLINGHDHLTFPGAPYVAPGAVPGGVLADGGVPERYEHRHDWRKGNDGHTLVSNGGSGTQDKYRWNELRQLVAGTTSISGSGGAGGLLRNLDAADTGTGPSRLGLNAGDASNYDTFPLGDSAGTELNGSCAYAKKPTASAIPATGAYLPHIAEGIEASARNEFLCLSGQAQGSVNVLTGRTAMIHGVGLKPSDVRLVAGAGTSLVWSPRSNVALYGDTAQATLYARSGVNISLGTDWVRSGSMNLLRELACVDYLNQSFFGRHFSDESLWRMVTVNAARAQVVGARVGVLAPGKVADVAIYRRGHVPDPYRAVVVAAAADVLLTVRGGKALFGQQELLGALGALGCESLDVCGAQRQVCLGGGELPAGATFASLSQYNASTYPLFFCSPPADEPTCSPMRGAPWLFSGSNAYAGGATANDSDGDGIPNAQDNCPGTFNPKRPMDNGKQGDADSDGTGDACDICPTTAHSTSCAPPQPGDADGDGTADGQDNCPFDGNPGQADADNDGKGDACDACPTDANPGTQACPPVPGVLISVYDAKDPAGALLNTQVQLKGALVTAVNAAGFFVQVHPGDPGYAGADRSGAYVHYPAPAMATLPRTDVNPGDRVDIPQATLKDYFGQVQFASVPAGTVAVVSAGNALPPFTVATVDEVATGGSRAAALEGVLVQLAAATVADTQPAPGAGDSSPSNEFTVTATSGGAQLRVNDFFYKVTPAQGDVFSLLRGVLQFRNGNSKLEPRDASDVALPARLAALGPGGQFVTIAAPEPSFPSALSVSLSAAQATDTVITVASSDVNVLDVGAGQVTVPAGQASQSLLLRGVMAGTATVTASLGTDSFNAAVTVLGASDVPTAVTFASPSASAPPNGKATLTVQLDLPAPSGGTTVTLSAGPLGTVPATVVVQARALSATVEFTAGATTGTETVTATLGSSTATATVAIQPTNTANHVVISEVQVAGATATDEFVELHNPTSSAVDVSGWKLQYRSASGTQYAGAGDMVTFPAGTVLPPGGYLLVGSPDYAGSVARDFTWMGGVVLSNSSGHVRLGTGALTKTLVDAATVDTVGYGSAAGPEGTAASAPAAGSSLERKAYASSTAVSLSVGGADADSGNGLDTNDNGADFVVRPASQPQNAASPAEQ